MLGGKKGEKKSARNKFEAARNEAGNMAQVKQAGYCLDTAVKRFRAAVSDGVHGKSLWLNGRNFDKWLLEWGKGSIWLEEK